MKCANWTLRALDRGPNLNLMRMVKGMRIHQLTFFGFAALALGGLSGCEGGQTGDLSGQNGNGGQETGSTDGCDVHKQKLDSFDEMTDQGSANQLLAYAEKSFEVPISWKAAPQGQAWSVGPESGEGQLHVDVARGESAYLLTYTPHQDSGSGAGIDIGVICPPAQLGVEAHVSVATEGGALAESYDTLLRSGTPGVATLSVPVDPSAVNGTLQLDSSDPQAKLVQLSLSATFTPSGMSGRFTGVEQVQHGTGPSSAVSASEAVLAVWPGGAACGDRGDGLVSPLDAEVLGFTGEATLASVATDEPVSIHWSSGEATTLTIGIQSTGDGCFTVRDNVPVEIGGGPAVSYPVTITLQSADGKVDGSYEGEVVASGYGDSRSVVSETWLNVAVGDLDQTGFSSVTVPDGADALQLRIVSSQVGGHASGSVRLVALTDPDCPPSTPMPTPDGGWSAPGCPGQAQTELESAAWGD
jgi:hypothetical protein